MDGHEPALVATTPSQAYALAGDLAALIDDTIIEGVDWRKLETLAPGRSTICLLGITLDFLKIAFAHWPQWLEERGLIDRARRVSLMVEFEIGGLEGSRPARTDNCRGLDRRQPRDRSAYCGNRAERTRARLCFRDLMVLLTSAPGR